MRLVLVLASMTAISGCTDPEPSPVRGDPRARNYQLASIDTDTNPVMEFDPSRPYQLKFGRGSGWDGLDTVAIDENGDVVLHRLQEEQDGDVIRQSWQTAGMTIDDKTAQRIAELILECGLLKLNRAYHADVEDGSQWVFWLVQGEGEKRIYCDNFFPRPVQDFAVELDSELEQAGADAVKWKPVPAEWERDHEKGLWESVER